ncbi:MAG TPA: hypothetical protein VGP24_11430, partial [Glaciihabitans sp.]|nr:hypothetical protein [Glaciihabitans sp.]
MIRSEILSNGAADAASAANKVSRRYAPPVIFRQSARRICSTRSYRQRVAAVGLARRLHEAKVR